MEKVMDWNEIARIIAREVAAQLGGKAEASCCAMILAQRDAGLADKVRRALGEDTDLFFLGEQPASDPVRYVVPYLCCSGMAALASGLALGSEAREVLRLLLAGRKVEVLEFEYLSHRETAPGPLYALYAAHAATLASFGLVPLEQKAPEEVRCWDTLVTADSVARMKHSGSPVLAVPSGAIVTPLADEAAREAGVAILKKL